MVHYQASTNSADRKTVQLNIDRAANGASASIGSQSCHDALQMELMPATGYCCWLWNATDLASSNRIGLVSLRDTESHSSWIALNYVYSGC